MRNLVRTRLSFGHATLVCYADARGHPMLNVSLALPAIARAQRDGMRIPVETTGVVWDCSSCNVACSQACRRMYLLTSGAIRRPSSVHLHIQFGKSPRQSCRMSDICHWTFRNGSYNDTISRLSEVMKIAGRMAAKEGVKWGYCCFISSRARRETFVNSSWKKRKSSGLAPYWPAL